MNKVIKIEDGKVLIGMRDGSMKKALISDVYSNPKVGDAVEVFASDSRVIVNRVGQENLNTNNGVSLVINNTPVVSGHVVNKATYVILAFLLGVIGIHKFYAGKTGVGVLYLLFACTGITSILTLVDIILALCKTSDVNGNILV